LKSFLITALASRTYKVFSGPDGAVCPFCVFACAHNNFLTKWLVT